MGTSADSNSYIGNADTSLPDDDDLLFDTAAEIRQVKLQLAATFPNFVGAAVSATEAELNYLDITTLGTAAASKALVADGSAEIDAGAITFTDLGTVTTADINGGTWQGTIDGTWTASGQTCTHLGTVSDADFTKLTIGGSAELTAVDTDLSSVAATDTTLASAKAIKAAIDAGAGLKLLDSIELASTLPGNNTASAQAHSEGTSLKLVTTYLECKTGSGGDANWAEGDRIELASGWSQGANSIYYIVHFDDAEVRALNNSSSWFIINKTTAVQVAATSSKWRLMADLWGY